MTARLLVKSVLLPIAIVLLAATTASAAYTYSTATTDINNVGSYSPDAITGVFGYDDINRELLTKAYNMKWSQTKVTTLSNYMADDKYYTIDLSVDNDYDKTVSAYVTSTYYTNLPGPHFDRDDDPEPFGNGFYDETEVTMLRPDLLTANQGYQFFSYWEVKATTGTTFAWTSQLSQPSLLGEYNVINFETHFTKKFPWW